ncbi:MAG: cytochrome P450 [Novosphingobium sp.]
MKDFDINEFVQRFDHHDPQFGPNIDAVFKHMRGHCPVARTEAYGGFWVLTRYKDVERVVRDDEGFSLRAGMSIPSNRAPGDPPWVLPGDLDPPESYTYRRLLEPVVDPRRLAEMEPWLRDVARELVDRIIERGEGDLVHDLAAPLTALATLRLTGLPEADWPHYVSERRSANRMVQDPEEAMRKVMERFTWTKQAFLEALEAQRAEPVEGGLIARLLEARIDGRPLEEWELLAILINFVTGGLETTQALLGSAWVHLARNPHDREDLLANMDLMPRAIEEILRYFSPQPGLARVATHDTEVGGQPLSEGEKVFMCWASANRDEEIFENADRFDIRRMPNRHLTFGAGAHHCLGANVTRLEARICMEEVLRRMPDYRLVEEGLEPIPDISTVQGYLSVPVRFTPAATSGLPAVLPA